MDGIANVAKQQQSHINSQVTQGRVAQQSQEQAKNVDIVKEMQDKSVDTTKFLDSSNIDSKEQVQDLVKKLNKAMAPISTNIKFGVDTQDIFYVSVIDTETSKMIRRFPAEQAADFLPKMQEVTGILFDSIG